MKARQSNEIVADYIKPYFSRHWDGQFGYYYTPPEKGTEYSISLICRNVCHICFPVFEAYFNYALHAHKSLVGKIIDRFLPRPMIRTSGIPSTARITVTGKDEYKLLHVRVTYPELRGKMAVIEEHNVLPAGARVDVRGEFDHIYLLPEMIQLEKCIDDGYTQIVLPEIKGYCMLKLIK